MSNKLAYQVIPGEISPDGFTVLPVTYYYPKTRFKTPHLNKIKRHILKRDPGATVELPKPKGGLLKEIKREEITGAVTVMEWTAVEGVNGAIVAAVENGETAVLQVGKESYPVHITPTRMLHRYKATVSVPAPAPSKAKRPRKGSV